MSTRGASFRTAFVIISYYRRGYPGRGDSRSLCCVTVGTWTGAQEAWPRVLVFDDSTCSGTQLGHTLETSLGSGAE